MYVCVFSEAVMDVYFLGGDSTVSWEIWSMERSNLAEIHPTGLVMS